MNSEAERSTRCFPCRQSKTKCDRVTPTCGRCRQRKRRCFGQTPVTDLIFVGENRTAECNSNRSRKPHRKGSNAANLAQQTYEDTSQTFSANVNKMRTSPVGSNRQTRLVSSVHWRCNSDRSGIPEPVPTPLTRSASARAVDRFFSNWILYAHPCASIPGAWIDLPGLYYNGSSNSALATMVEAVAYAEVRNVSDGALSFAVKARLKYASALKHIRQTIFDQKFAHTDVMLITILLLDQFELMYLNRTDLTGSHDGALQYILRLRDQRQTPNDHSFTLWGMTQHHLQGRQLLAKRGSSDSGSMDCKTLPGSQPLDVQVLSDAPQITALWTTISDIEKKIECNGSVLALDSHMHDAQTLKARIREKICESEKRLEAVCSSLGGLEGQLCIRQGAARQLYDVMQSIQAKQSDQIQYVKDRRDSSQHEIVWLTCLWSFCAACQISLREAFVSITRICCTTDRYEQYFEVVKHEERVINDLSINIVDLATPVMEYQEGAMTARASLLFGLKMVEQSPYTTSTTKQLALETHERLRKQHIL